MGAGVQPNWESKSDWMHTSSLLEVLRACKEASFKADEGCVKAHRLGMITPGEITQPALHGVEDWKEGAV